jgi:hypothetical protein
MRRAYSRRSTISAAVSRGSGSLDELRGDPCKKGVANRAVSVILPILEASARDNGAVRPLKLEEPGGVFASTFSGKVAGVRDRS